MKKLVLSGLLLLSGLSVGQEKSPVVNVIKNQNKEVTRKMLDIYKQVKTADDRPRYEIEFSQDACGYEILINDVSSEQTPIR